MEAGGSSLWSQLRRVKRGLYQTSIFNTGLGLPRLFEKSKAAEWVFGARLSNHAKQPTGQPKHGTMVGGQMKEDLIVNAGASSRFDCRENALSSYTVLRMYSIVVVVSKQDNQ